MIREILFPVGRVSILQDMLYPQVPFVPKDVQFPNTELNPLARVVDRFDGVVQRCTVHMVLNDIFVNPPADDGQDTVFGLVNDAGSDVVVVKVIQLGFVIQSFGKIRQSRIQQTVNRFAFFVGHAIDFKLPIIYGVDTEIGY